MFCRDIEMSINITYYKDIVFASVTLIEFSGMLHVNRKQYLQQLNESREEHFQVDIFKTQIVYRWLICMVTANCIWLFVTIVLDHERAFYRKAAIFKKRVKEAIQ